MLHVRLGMMQDVALARVMGMVGEMMVIHGHSSSEFV
jgi:hypothetical protein